MHKPMIGKGRKFTIAVLAMWQGTAVTIFAMLAAAMKPASATAIASIAEAFAGILMVGVGSFTAGNTAIGWKHGGGTKVSTASETVIQNPPVTAP